MQGEGKAQAAEKFKEVNEALEVSHHHLSISTDFACSRGLALLRLWIFALNTKIKYAPVCVGSACQLNPSGAAPRQHLQL